MGTINREKLEYLNQLFAREMKENRIQGAALRIIHNEDIVFDEIYGSDKEDSIYRIFSMSKPIAALAVMILYERGMLDLYEPLYKYLPAFKEMKVVGENGLEEAKNPILLKHLMNMTSGLMYPDDTGMAELCMCEIEDKVVARIRAGEKQTLPEICSMFAEAPLKFEPGKRWAYGTSTDVMGAVVEVISGMTYGEFLKKEIFDPLQMKDTSFCMPEEKKRRIAKMYTRVDEEGHLNVLETNLLDFLGMEYFDGKPTFESAGGGLLSTVEDYTHVVKMMLNEGVYEGKRILGRKTFSFMHSNQLSTEQEASIYFDSLYGYSYGNFLRTLVNKAEACSNGSIAEYGWDGLPGNYFFIDPEENLGIVYMQQIEQGADQSLRRKMRQIIYGALE